MQVLIITSEKFLLNILILSSVHATCTFDMSTFCAIHSSPSKPKLPSAEEQPETPRAEGAEEMQVAGASHQQLPGQNNGPARASAGSTGPGRACWVAEIDLENFSFCTLAPLVPI